MTKSDGDKRVSALPKATASARKETSALISLEELLLSEQSRIREEEAARRGDEERGMRARIEAEAKAQEAERAQLRAEEDARREAVRLNEARRARFEAEGLAAVAAARVKAETQAKLAMMQVANHQALELAGATKRASRSSAAERVVLGLLFLVAMGTLSFYLERAEARAQSLQQALARAETDRDEHASRLARMVPKEERDALSVRLNEAEEQLRRLRAEASGPLKPGSAAASGTTMRAHPKLPSGGAADPCAFYRKLRETSPHDPRLFDPANGCL